jgi:hypothetical protein
MASRDAAISHPKAAGAHMPAEAKIPTPPPAPKPARPEPPDAGHLPMTEEMDSAKWSLPPIVPVLIALALVAIAVAIYTVHGIKFVPRPNGKITGMTAAEQKMESAIDPAQSRVLVAVQVSISNPGEKPVYVQGANAEVQADAPKPLKDDAAAASDFDRYVTAFPELKSVATTPLKPETKIMPGETTSGTLLFGFPLSKDAFNKKKSMKVWLKLYDHEAIELKQ